MPLEVIGAGFGRTGTLSLKFALEKLGFSKCYHMTEVFGHPEHVPMWAAAHRGEPVDWEKLYDGYRATVDWPSRNLWETHAKLYPDAKVILTVRDPDAWHKSVMSTIYLASNGMRHADDPNLRRMASGRTRSFGSTCSTGAPRTAHTRSPSTAPTSRACRRRSRSRGCSCSRRVRAGNRCAAS